MSRSRQARLAWSFLPVAVFAAVAGYPTLYPPVPARAAAVQTPAPETAAPAAPRGRGARGALPEGYSALGQPTLRGEAPGMRGEALATTGRAVRVTARTGDEVVSGLAEFAAANGITSAYITGVGGFGSAVFGWYDPQVGGLKRIEIDEKVEVNSFNGNYTTNQNGVTNVHVHAIVTGADGIARGGHLIEARVNPTMELYIVDVAPAGAPPLPQEGQ